MSPDEDEDLVDVPDAPLGDEAEDRAPDGDEDFLGTPLPPLATDDALLDPAAGEGEDAILVVPAWDEATGGDLDLGDEQDDVLARLPPLDQDDLGVLGDDDLVDELVAPDRFDERSRALYKRGSVGG